MLFYADCECCALPLSFFKFFIAWIFHSQLGDRTESIADRSLTDLQDRSCSLCERLDFWDSRERQMLSAAELRGRANSVSASHTVIPVSSAGPSAACMPVQFQPHALIRAPQLSGLELAEKGCHSAQNCSVPRLRCWLCHRSSLGRTRVLPLAKQKKNGHAVLQWTQKHIYIVPDIYSTQWWDRLW